MKKKKTKKVGKKTSSKSKSLPKVKTVESGKPVDVNLSRIQVQGRFRRMSSSCEFNSFNATMSREEDKTMLSKSENFTRSQD